MEKNKKGFTLIELVVVMVIVGILSAISVPVYRGYVEKAIMAEGNMLLGAIAKAELAYYVQHKRFVAIDKTQEAVSEFPQAETLIPKVCPCLNLWALFSK